MAIHVMFDDGTMEEMTEEEARSLMEFQRKEQIFWSIDPNVRPHIEKIKDRRLRIELWGVVNLAINAGYEAGLADAAKDS